MSTYSLRCNNCGSNLHLPPKSRYVTCTFCNSSLIIKREGNTAFTEVLDDIKDDTEAILNNTEVLKLESELERLERDWEKREAVSKKHAKQASAKQIILFIIFAIPIMLVLNLVFKMPGLFRSLGGLLIIAAIINAIVIYFEKKSYYRGSEMVRREFVSKKRSILDQLDKLRQAQ